MKLTNWAVKRSGDAMTVTGREQREGEDVGHEVKLTDVILIRRVGNIVVAGDKDGEEHILD